MMNKTDERIKVFWLFLGYRFFTMLASEMVQAAIPLLLYQKTSSVTWSGIAYAATWLPRVLFQPMMGALIDAMSVRIPFLLSDFARSGVALILIFLHTPIFLLLGGASFSLFSGMAFIAVEHAVTHSLGMKRTPDVQSRLQFAEQSAIILGPLLAAVLVSASAGNLVFLSTCGIFALALPINNWVYLEKRGRSNIPEFGDLLGRMALGIREILAKASLLGLAGTTAAINFIEGSCVAALPARVVGSLQHSESSIGIILAISAGQNLLLLFLISRYFGSANTRKVLKIGLLLIPFGAFLFGISESVWISGLGYIMLIVGRVLFVLHMRIERARLIGPESFSATMGAFLSIVLFPLPLAGIALSVFGPVLGVEQYIEGIAVLFALIATPVFLLRRGSRTTKIGDL